MTTERATKFRTSKPMQRIGIKILPPDVNKTMHTFFEPDGIRYSINSIKGGDNALKDL